MLEEKRKKFEKIENKIGEIFSKFGPSPNQYTLNSIVFGFFSFLFLIYRNFLFSLIFFFIAAFLDFVDGAVARYKKMVTKKGAFLDTISDRFVEGLIFLGLLSLPLPKIFFEARFWIFLAFFGSMMTTYSKAAAKEKELVTQELKKGLFGRGERIILIFLTIFLGIFNFSWMIYPIIVLAILSNFTALQRIYLGFKSPTDYS
jgi:archaetidylinositol phosphate synthase